MPSIFEQLYRITANTHLSPEELNLRFRSLDQRLQALEADNTTLDATIAELRAEGVTRLTTALQTQLPDILADAQTGYLTGLAPGSIAWESIDLSDATPASVGAEAAGVMATHLATPGVHSISDVADLATALSGKQPSSALLSAIAGAAPVNLGLPVGTGTTYQVLPLEAGDSIAIGITDGKLRIDATGSASGESNSGANVGAGAGVYSGKSGTTLQFRSLVPANNLLTIVEDGDLLSLGVAQENLSLAIGQVTNLATELGSRQPLAAHLTTIAGLTPAQGQLLIGDVNGGFQLGDLIAGTNITITPGPSGLTIAAAASGEANTASNLGSTGARLFSAKSGVDLQFRRLNSLASFLTLAEASNTVNLDFSPTGLVNALDNNAIAWGKVSKSGAVAADVGAEPEGAVAIHAAGSNVHAIAGVTGLESALNARVELVKTSTQTMQTSIAITPATANVGSYTPNAANQNYFVLTQTSNTTINNPTGLASGKVQFLDFTLIQDGTGGRTTTWGSVFTWGDAGQPTPKTTANAVNVYVFKHWNNKLYFVGHRAY